MRGLFQNICKLVFVLLIYYAQKVIVCTHVNYARLMSRRFANEMAVACCWAGAEEAYLCDMESG